jgi:hypothetical protein
MRTVVVIFILALVTIAGELYSDAALRSDEVSGTAATGDSTAGAAAYGLNSG